MTATNSSQSAAVISGAGAYLSSYTQASPIASLETQIFIDNLLASTTPSAAQQSSIEALFNNAESGILADPSGFVASVSSLVSPFGFASAVYSYENGFVNGLRTVVAADIGVTVSPSTSSSTGGVPRATAGVAAGAVGIVAGLVGVGLL